MANNKSKKRPLLTDSNATAKKNKGQNSLCPVCEASFKSGQESIFCEGECQKYVHRQCAGLTKGQFAKAAESDSPYYCLHCTVSMQNTEICKLKQLVSELTAIIKPSTPLQTSATIATNVLPSNQVHNNQQNSVTIQHSNPASSQSTDRKFNLVIYGLNECPNGTSRPERVKQDIDKGYSVLSKVDEDINVSSVRDCLRLGKYKKDQARPRPLLLKLNRAIDVISVLSNRASLEDKSIVIKPDMSPEEKQIESLLLKERWSLMQSGINKTDIKIKSGSIFVKGKKHGYVSNSVFFHVNPSPAVVPTNVPSQSVNVDNN